MSASIDIEKGGENQTKRKWHILNARASAQGRERDGKARGPNERT